MWLENVFGTVHCSHFQDLGFVLSENNVHFASILEAKKVPIYITVYHFQCGELRVILLSLQMVLSVFII